MAMRICPGCGSHVPVSNLLCHGCKQLLPSMLQLAHTEDKNRHLHMPDQIGGGSLNRAAGGTGKLSKIFQTLARK